MKKISTREYSKHYILNLLPSASSNDELTYVATAKEVENLEKWMSLMAKHFNAHPIVAQNLNVRIAQLKKDGGALLSLKTVFIPAQNERAANLVHLDLSYAVTKDVQFLYGGKDVSELVSKSDKLTGLVTRFMKDLYAGHEECFGCDTRDAFVDELYLIDDIDLVVDENANFKINVDRSLRDYLVELNARLRVSA